MVDKMVMALAFVTIVGAFLTTGVGHVHAEENVPAIVTFSGEIPPEEDVSIDFYGRADGSVAYPTVSLDGVEKEVDEVEIEYTDLAQGQYDVEVQEEYDGVGFSKAIVYKKNTGTKYAEYEEPTFTIDANAHLQVRIQYGEYTPHSPPKPLSPINGETISTKNLNISWEYRSGVGEQVEWGIWDKDGQERIGLGGVIPAIDHYIGDTQSLKVGIGGYEQDLELAYNGGSLELPSGRYYWRLRSKDSHGNWSIWSEKAWFEFKPQLRFPCSVTITLADAESGQVLDGEVKAEAYIGGLKTKQTNNGTVYFEVPSESFELIVPSSIGSRKFVKIVRGQPGGEIEEGAVHDNNKENIESGSVSNSITAWYSSDGSDPQGGEVSIISYNLIERKVFPGTQIEWMGENPLSDETPFIRTGLTGDNYSVETSEVSKGSNFYEWSTYPLITSTTIETGPNGSFTSWYGKGALGSPEEGIRASGERPPEPPAPISIPIWLAVLIIPAILFSYLAYREYRG